MDAQNIMKFMCSKSSLTYTCPPIVIILQNYFANSFLSEFQWFIHNDKRHTNGCREHFEI